MKIHEYPQLNALTDDSIMLVDTPNGTRHINRGSIAYSLYDNIPEMHKELYRGKHIGTRPTEAQMQAIQNGTFTDMWLGDYWLNQGFRWTIVDFNYWKHIPSVTKNHIVVMPDINMGSAVTANSTPTSEYGTSWLHNQHMEGSIRTQIANAFSNAFVSHPEIFGTQWTNVTAVQPGYGYLADAETKQVEVMCLSERMIWGSNSRGINSHVSSASSTFSGRQLSLFAKKGLPNPQNGFWLSDTASQNHLCVYGNDGSSRANWAHSTRLQVRPVFAIGR